MSLRSCDLGGDPGHCPVQAGTHGLQILNAQKEDAGQYTCVVTNELGEAMKNYHVEVLSESGTLRDSGRADRRLFGSEGTPGAWAPTDTLRYLPVACLL